MINPLNKKKLALRPAQIILLGFIAIILVGACFLSLPISSKARTWTNLLDSIFMSASAVCVTGLSVLSPAHHYSIFGQIVLLLLVQIGGLGFMTATTFVMLIIRKKISFKDRLSIQDSLNQDSVKGMVRLVRSIIIFTFSAELIGAIILLPFFIIDNGAIGIWQAIFTSISAFCNAGFDLFTNTLGQSISLTSYLGNPVVTLTIAFLIILGGIGFAVIVDIHTTLTKRKNYRKLSMHTKVVLSVTTFLLLFGTLMFFILEYNNPLTLGTETFFQKLLNSFFQSVTARTAGFYTIDQSALHPASKLIFSVLMFIGASPGSTGGGIKTTTFLLIIVTIVSVMKGRDDVVIFKHKINYKSVYKALSVFALGLILVIFLTAFIMIAEHNNQILHDKNLYDFNNILFDAMSTFSTTGLSTGITPYLSPISKLMSIIVMFIGRVGLMTFGVALFVDKDSSLIKYPESNIGIG